MEAETKEERPWLQFYLEGVPADVDIPDKSVPQAFGEAVEKWRNKTALIFYGAKISYRQLKEEVDRFATALHDLGVKKGDKVALLLLNSPQFIIAYFGALEVGATLTPISPVYVSPEIKHQIEDSGAKTLICQDILYDHVEKAEVKLERVILTNIAEYLPRLKKFLARSMLRGVYQKMSAPPVEIFEREGFYQFQELIKKYPPNPPKIEFNPKEDLTHYNLIAGESLTRAFLAPILEDGKEVDIAYLPFYHIYGQVVVMLGGIVRGSTLVIFSTPDLDDILNAIESHRATVSYSVPALYEALRDYARTNRVNWKRFKILISGADALLEDTARGWERRTGVKIHEGYGMTETSSVATISPYGRPQVGSFGIPLPNTMAVVVDPESNEFLPVGEVGELLLRGPQIMGGYWNKPEETKSMLVEIGGEIWLRTGDMVRRDEEGYFYFYDRKRDMIKYKGYAVFAREVEEVLTSHPQIKEAGIVGIPDPKVGENIKAMVVLETEARGKLSEEEIIKYCQERLAHYKIPKIIEFRGEVPKTDVGKVSRRELREEEEV